MLGQNDMIGSEDAEKEIEDSSEGSEEESNESSSEIEESSNAWLWGLKFDRYGYCFDQKL